MHTITLWASMRLITYKIAESRVEIRSDNAGAIGDLVAASDPLALSDADPGVPVSYTFSNLTLPAGEYWLVPAYVGYENTTFYGASYDAYADGFWSATPAQDLYFKVN